MPEDLIPCQQAAISSNVAISSQEVGFDTEALTDSLPLAQLPGPVSWDLVFDGANPTPGVTVTPTKMDFGACSMRTSAEQRGITVTNTTQASNNQSIWMFCDLPVAKSLML